MDLDTCRASDPAAAEASLDPDDWEAFRSVAHAALDQSIDFVQTLRERPVWQAMPASVKAELAQPVPSEPAGVEQVYQEFLKTILPFGVGNVHPRFFGWVHGAGLPSGMVSGILEAAMDLNCGGRDHCGLHLERLVIDWCKAIFGFPEKASGILLSGTSMATLTGLTVARNSRCAHDIRSNGLKACPKPLVAYASSGAHECVAKALDILGIGSKALRRIDVNERFELDIPVLVRAIDDDRAAGLEPFCVVGTAGSVNTGAVDDLVSLAGICRENNLWFHVDGAFGALGILCDEIRPRLRGIELADSLAFDFHKWMHVQYDAGCLLVRDGEAHLRSFSMRPDYLGRTSRGLAGGGVWPCDLGPELSRGFRALRIWFALKEHGTAGFARAIAANCRQAKYLAVLAAETPGVQIMSGPSLGILCFRFVPPGWGCAAVDRLNEDIVADLQESGIAAPSTTRIHGFLSIRVNITNHRTRLSDLDVLMSAAVNISKRLIDGN